MKLSEKLISSSNQNHALQSILILTLVSGVALALLTFAGLVYPFFGWNWLTIPLAIVMLEAILTTNWISSADQRLLNKWLYRGVEVFLILVLARISVWAIHSSWPNEETWINFVRNPLLLISDGLFWVTTLLLLFSWERTMTYATLFQAMKLDPAELAYIKLPRRERERQERPKFSVRGELFEQFGAQWIIGAIIMALLTAASTVEYSNFSDTSFQNLFRLPLHGGILIALLLYFGAGFALLSRGRLAVQNAMWLHSGLNKRAGVDQSWHRTTLWLLLALGLIAAFLPLGSTSLIGRFLAIAIIWLAQIGTALTFLFFLLISLLFPRIGAGEADSAPPEPFVPPVIPQAPPEAPPAEPGFPIVGTIFWVVLGIVTLLALLYFLQNRSLRLSLKLSPFWAGLSNWWQSLWRVTRLAIVDLRDAVVTRLVRDDEVGFDLAQPWRFVRLNALTPRQKLRYFYLSTVRRAEERGLEREESDTPIEYAGELKTSWPSADQQVDGVTAGFLKARYSQSDISEEDVEAVQAEWKALRKKLKGKGIKGKG